MTLRAGWNLKASNPFDFQFHFKRFSHVSHRPSSSDDHSSSSLILKEKFRMHYGLNKFRYQSSSDNFLRRKLEFSKYVFMNLKGEEEKKNQIYAFRLVKAQVFLWPTFFRINQKKKKFFSLSAFRYSFFFSFSISLPVKMKRNKSARAVTLLTDWPRLPTSCVWLLIVLVIGI